MKERSLRIVAGVWKNRRLAVAPGSRPTSERAREAFFDILGPWIRGKRMLELYAGSGAVAIEALSRGAAEAVAVDRETRALELNRRTLEAPLEVVSGAVAEAVRRLAAGGRHFDLVFLDPPYAADDPVPTSVLAALLAPGGRIAWQTDARVELDPSPLRIVRRAAYGRNVFTFLEPA